MLERRVKICNVIKKMYFILGQKQTRSNRMNGSITPSLVEKATLLVQMIEKVQIRFRSKPGKVSTNTRSRQRRANSPFETANLEIRPKMTVIPSFPAIIR